MMRLTPLVAGVLAVLVAACTSAAIDQPTASASIAASSPTTAPVTPSVAPISPSTGPSPAPTKAPVLPSPPTGITAGDNSSGKVGTMFTVRLTWAPAAATDAYRVYLYRTGEGPGYGKCVFDKAMAELLAETQPGATGAEVSLNEAETGSGERCVYVVAVTDAGESPPTLAWRSD